MVGHAFQLRSFRISFFCFELLNFIDAYNAEGLAHALAKLLHKRIKALELTLDPIQLDQFARDVWTPKEIVDFLLPVHGWQLLIIHSGW
jgi:hypothetical protein